LSDYYYLGEGSSKRKITVGKRGTASRVKKKKKTTTQKEEHAVC